MKVKILDWLYNHDDRWSFILLYAGGAVVLSIFMSLFWVGLLMVVHLGIEILRHRLIGVRGAFLHALWHVKLDMALFLFAISVVVYSDMVIGLLGAGQALRGAQMVARFGIIERSLRVVLLTADDAMLLLRGVAKGVSRRTAPDTPIAIPKEEVSGPPWMALSKGDWFSLSFAALCLGLTLISPALTGRGWAETALLILSELRP